MGPVKVGESAIHGLGVFAQRDFQAGEIVLRIDDSRVVDADHPIRPECGEFEHHCDYLAGGQVVLMHFPERHINHSCDPNTYVKTLDKIRHVIALRRIAAGEEITYDYIINCDEGDVWECRCGAARCRATIVSSFFDLPIEWQKRYVPLLDDWFVAEHQERLDSVRAALAAS